MHRPAVCAPPHLEQSGGVGTRNVRAGGDDGDWPTQLPGHARKVRHDLGGAEWGVHAWLRMGRLHTKGAQAHSFTLISSDRVLSRRRGGQARSPPDRGQVPSEYTGGQVEPRMNREQEVGSSPV
eukprot:365154-Chlamydomonas_euryale.AAC.13